MRVGSFNAAVVGEPLMVPAILFGQFAVHSSFGFGIGTGGKGRAKSTHGKISVSHCATGMCFSNRDDLMSAVYLAEEMQRIVPAEIANETNANVVASALRNFYRTATLEVLGRQIGGWND